jgi:ABC-type phosphate transport system auxiliary subunit
MILNCIWKINIGELLLLRIKNNEQVKIKIETLRKQHIRNFGKTLNQLRINLKHLEIARVLADVKAVCLDIRIVV